MKTSLDILKEVESRIEYLVKHVEWLKKQSPEMYPSIKQEELNCVAQIAYLKILWAFIMEK